MGNNWGYIKAFRVMPLEGHLVFLRSSFKQRANNDLIVIKPRKTFLINREGVYLVMFASKYPSTYSVLASTPNKNRTTMRSMVVRSGSK